MSIGSNIARFRKNKKMTQEQLGQLLGVSNQSVSKWEKEISFPDIMLLPKIAEVFNVSIEELYGADNQQIQTSEVTADSFPVWLYENAFELFYKQSGCYFKSKGETYKEQLQYWKRKMEKGLNLGCFSDTQGAVVITKETAMIDKSFRKGNAFSSPLTSSSLKILSMPNIRTILEMGYEKIFGSDNLEKELLFEDFQPNLTLNDVHEALYLLLSIGIVKNDRDLNNNDHFTFDIVKLFYANMMFRLSSMLINDDGWLVIRESSMISDYAFSKKAKNLDIK